MKDFMNMMNQVEISFLFSCFPSSFPAEHQCTAPRAVDNVIYQNVKEIYSDGQFQEFKCEPGYTSDSGRIKCDNGRWEKPDCKRN